MNLEVLKKNRILKRTIREWFQTHSPPKYVREHLDQLPVSLGCELYTGCTGLDTTIWVKNQQEHGFLTDGIAGLPLHVVRFSKLLNMFATNVRPCRHRTKSVIKGLLIVSHIVIVSFFSIFTSASSMFATATPWARLPRARRAWCIVPMLRLRCQAQWSVVG